MADSYQYQKKRKEFGRYGQFEDTDTKIVGSVAPDINCKENFVDKNPNRFVSSNIGQNSTHCVNTERIPTGSKGMKHTEGGWPIEIDSTEPSDQAKYMKKMARDPTLGFPQAIRDMSNTATSAIMQNNQIDLYEEYFSGEQGELLADGITLKTKMIFKDPNQFKRSATQITWHPDQSELRVGVSYSMLRFQ